MEDNMSKLEKLGFNQWVQANPDFNNLPQNELARVIAVHRGGYIINDGQNDIVAQLLGKANFEANSAIDYPGVGDWVRVTFHNDKNLAIIQEVLFRKSIIKRKTSGKKIDFQLIATNIDVAFIVQALDNDFSIARLERYLVMINDSNIESIALLSKSDLQSEEEIEIKIKEIKTILPHLQVLPFSNETELNLAKIKELLKPELTYCMLGSSGVGKTTLLNKLLGEAVFETQAVRGKDNKGRHTTTSRNLIFLENGSMIIDTPGMRELGNIAVETGVEETFDDIIAIGETCLFNDCTHNQIKGCAVLAAVENGTLSRQRYENYLKINKESSYNKMSYFEKKQKDKKFKKFCKLVLKDKQIRENI